MKKSLGAKTIVYPTPVFIVGVYDANGKANAMAVAWGGICCSRPPCIAISLRKATYTYGCIVNRKAFSVNIPSEDFLAQADYFGMASGKHEDKFEVTGLTPEKGLFVDAPVIAEFPCVIECSLLHTVEIGLHTQFIGEIKDVRIEESCFRDEKTPSQSLIRPLLYSPTDQEYFSSGKSLGKAYDVGFRFMKQK